jgi:hypothetical protein
LTREVHQRNLFRLRWGHALTCADYKNVLKDRPLGEVASEFNRYGSTPVDREDEELRALPVSDTKVTPTT